MIADKWKISREEMDDFAVESHCRAASAADIGKQIFPVNGLTA